MADAQQITNRRPNEVYKTLAAAIGIGEIQQAADGRPSVFAGGNALASGDTAKFLTDGQFVVTKTNGITILDGGEVWWDHSANSATFRRNGDRDFYLGTAVGDAASADLLVTVQLGARVVPAIDLLRDPFVTAIVGTQALGGLALNTRGGCLNAVLSSVNEAQKVDALSVDTFSNAANGIIEMSWRVVNDGAGSNPDLSLGAASGTHATDADSIAQHLLMHLDGNSVNISFQSKDGTTTVAATDSTIDYTEGAALANRVEVWLDMRNPADVQIYVNGVNVLGATVFNVSAAASEWKLLLHLEKTSSADVYEFDLDKLRVRTAEQ